jgi:hypothetical protein
LGRVHAEDDARTAGPWCVVPVGSVFRTFPRFEASGGGQRPWEGTACLGNMRRRGRKPRHGRLNLIGLALFKHVFLPKIE